MYHKLDRKRGLTRQKGKASEIRLWTKKTTIRKKRNGQPTSLD